MAFPLTAFLTLSISSAFSPGPNNITCMVLGQQIGFKKSIPYILGIISGYTVLLIGISLFHTLIAQYIPTYLLGILGAVYLCYLAWTLLQTSSKKQNTRLIESNFFLAAFLFQFINPKGVLFGITLISSFAFPYANNIPIGLIVSFLVFLTLCSVSIWAVFGSLLQHFLYQHQKKFNLVMALLLIYSAFVVSGISNLWIY
ncbi:MAG: LysE family translocator [Brevinema sp.]